MAICRACDYNSIHAGPVSPFRTDEHCTKCHCTLAAKTKCLSCACPEHYWEGVITSEEEQKIENNGK
jgi:hypothetical protein